MWQFSIASCPSLSLTSLNYSKTKPPPNGQLLPLILPSAGTYDLHRLNLTGFDHKCDKDSERGYKQILSVIRILLLCLAHCSGSKLTSLVYTSCEGNGDVLWWLIVYAQGTEGGQLAGLISSGWNFGRSMHDFGHASKIFSLGIKRPQGNFIFCSDFSRKTNRSFCLVKKDCWGLYSGLLCSFVHSRYYRNTWLYISSPSFTPQCTWWAILSDSGPQFRKHTIGQFAVKFGFRHITAKLHHSQ